MRARSVDVRPTAPAVIGAEAVALVAFALLPPHRLGWWPASLIAVVGLLSLVVRMHRRHAAAWLRDRWRWWRRRRVAVTVAAAVDLPCGDVKCGVRVEAHEAITMVAVAGRAFEPTFLSGSTTFRTRNLLPLQVLVDALDQPDGLRISTIDVVSAGHRVRRGAGYPALYGTLLADRPAAGQRATRLVLRLDLQDSMEGLAYRRSIGAAAVAATDRVLVALRQAGVRCTALAAAELNDAVGELGVGLVSVEGSDGRLMGRGAGRRGSAPKVSWHSVSAQHGHLTSYSFSPDDVTTAGLNQMWALRSDSIVQTLALRRKHRTGRVLVSALVRTEEPRPPLQPPALFLNPLPGNQERALLAAAPITRRGLRIPERELEDSAALRIPIGSTGILVGAALHDDPDHDPPIRRDDLIMLPLTDPCGATRVLMDVGEFYLRQLVLRAAAAGERIAVHAREPDRWSAVAQPNVVVLEPGRRVDIAPTILVTDDPAGRPASTSSTVIVAAGGVEGCGEEADLRFEQTGSSTIRISCARWCLELAIVAFRQEQAWTG